MFIEPYQIEQLSFAWSNKVYSRVQTYRRVANHDLARLNEQVFGELLANYGIHVLECAATAMDVRALVSLTPHDSVSAAISKMKGRLSKWLGNTQSTSPTNRTLASGYFAVTTGKSTENEVERYLSRQCEHHGYAKRPRPPVFVQAYPRDEETKKRLATEHAVTSLRYHVVLATQYRQGVFGDVSARAVAERWRSEQSSLRIAIDKVSFVPDHVHLAVAAHPSVAPAQVIVALMNVSQDLMWRDFSVDVIRARVSRLWQPSAYMGSFGDLRSSAISTYVRRWENRSEGESF